MSNRSGTFNYKLIMLVQVLDEEIVLHFRRGVPATWRRNAIQGIQTYLETSHQLQSFTSTLWFYRYIYNLSQFQDELLMILKGKVINDHLIFKIF